MDQDYDYIVLGTGLKECILSGLLSCAGKTVLHMDRNNFYGGESASLNLEQLFERFKPEQKIPEEFGRSRDYNVDLCPKFIMSAGNLVRILLHTKVTRYLEFGSVDGSFVMKDGKVHKVPSTAAEALSSSLMGMFQKRRFKNYLNFVEAFDKEDPETWQKMDPHKTTNAQLFDHFSCDANTQAFTGHAMALYLDDKYLQEPFLECVERVKMYAYSVSRYGNSPYIYPVWGLGGLPEGFSRLAAIHGGVFMLNKPVEEILYDDSGKVIGVKSQGEVARCKKLLADPSYFLQDGQVSDKVKKGGQVARCIVLLDHPVPNTNDAESCQIIIPAKQVPGRNSDIYISVVSAKNRVVAPGKWVAVIQLTAETETPKEEMKPALALLGNRLAAFFWVSDQYKPANDSTKDNVFITETYDPTSHFETSTQEVMRLFEQMEGKPVDLSQPPEELDQEPQ